MEEHEHRLEMIAQAVAELPDRTRYILEQCYFEHKKYAEVAESLSVTRDAVKKQISKALSILRQKLNVINF
jgi:RNA polymerase sigma-70 factor (ECF subfamily)